MKMIVACHLLRDLRVFCDVGIYALLVIQPELVVWLTELVVGLVDNKTVRSAGGVADWACCLVHQPEKSMIRPLFIDQKG